MRHPRGLGAAARRPGGGDPEETNPGETNKLFGVRGRTALGGRRCFSENLGDKDPRPPRLRGASALQPPGLGQPPWASSQGAPTSKSLLE